MSPWTTEYSWRLAVTCWRQNSVCLVESVFIPWSLAESGVLVMSCTVCWADCLMIQMVLVCLVSLYVTDLNVFFGCLEFFVLLGYWGFLERVREFLWMGNPIKEKWSSRLHGTCKGRMRPRLWFCKFILFTSLVGITSSDVILETS